MQREIMPAKPTAHPLDEMLAIAGRLFAEALIEQLPAAAAASAAPAQPLDPFWVNDTGFRMNFTRAREKMNEPMSEDRAAIIMKALESLSR